MITIIIISSKLAFRVDQVQRFTLDSDVEAIIEQTVERLLSRSTKLFIF